ncbi:MAG: peptidyl-prolyl cis-trans isomerase [Myxococcales bacterium]|jgi:peptidyl-prolyl cis-trans isomerase A (cyclophilin A)|nr:peptidyl-prolyl cis-trans isomerase [Myxococcales bacterium]
MRITAFSGCLDRPLVTILAGFLAVLPLSALAQAPAGGDDPAKGNFTLDEATKGVPGKGTLVAVIETTEGKFHCELYEKQAPITVANFVGLARGVRPWKDPKTGEWVKKPLYDGLIFHRVIPGFMIQGGDPLGVGMGNPGYRFKDEIAPDLKFDKPGLLAMANSGPATNGSQFFITEGTPEHLTGRHTIFGLCDPVSLVTKIAGVPKGPRDKPVTDVVIKKVTISREKPGKRKGADK